MSTAPDNETPVRLTSLSHGAGCACKLSARELSGILKDLPAVDDPRSLVDASTRDDAAVYKMSDDKAIVATLDFFTPIVDDAYTFGAIATANAFSDVYAMGATPLLGLSIVAWPRDPTMLSLLNRTMRGATDVAKQAGVFVLGGHSIDDAEPKFGMVALGEVDMADMVSNANSKIGDVLLLTKPLGTGIMTTALKRDLITDEQLQPAVESMSRLNVDAASVMREHRQAVHAATDVTGFGLIGHLRNMLEACGHSARISTDELPVIPGVRELIGEGVLPGGTRRNHEAACEITQWSDAVSRTDQFVMTDAQTSGGLLIAVDPDHVDAVVRSLTDVGTLAQAIIGEIIPREEYLVSATSGP